MSPAADRPGIRAAENEPALQALGDRVLTVPSAEAALEVLDGAVPDLILTDVHAR